MKSNTVMTYLFVAVVGFFTFRAYKVVAAPKVSPKVNQNAQTKPAVAAVVNNPALQKAAPVNNAAGAALRKPPLASLSKSYSVQQLLTLINMNNPQRNSAFIVLLTDNTGAPTGSKSTINAGFERVIQANLNTMVTLKQDLGLLNTLVAKGKIFKADYDAFAKILLYFELDGNRFYLVDPFPASAVAGMAGRSGRYPAGDMMKKWDYTSTY